MADNNSSSLLKKNSSSSLVVNNNQTITSSQQPVTTITTTKFTNNKVHHNHNHQQNNDIKVNNNTNKQHNTNVIHRTTSESLRVGGNAGGGAGNSNNDTPAIPSITATTGTMRESIRKQLPTAKGSSFQITSVTVGTSRSTSGGDNGEDSADDLDESHTDDNSRITDIENETPSYSEDTSFSKEDVFYSNNSLGTAPVIPTSAQYGLAIVSPMPDGSMGGGLHGHIITSDMQLSMSEGGNIVNIVSAGGQSLKSNDVDALNHRNERFKVVKIESTEPFKRGRWVCMDYLDHTTLQQQQREVEDHENIIGQPTTKDSGLSMNDTNIDMDSAASLTIHNDISGTAGAQSISLGENYDSGNYDGLTDLQYKDQKPHTHHQNHHHPQSMIHVPFNSNVPTATPQTMPHLHFQQMLAAQHQQQSLDQQVLANSNLMESTNQQEIISHSSSQQQQSAPVFTSTVNSNVMQQQPQLIPYVHGTTMPINMNQLIMNTNSMQQTQQQPPQPVLQNQHHQPMSMGHVGNFYENSGGFQTHPQHAIDVSLNLVQNQSEHLINQQPVGEQQQVFQPIDDQNTSNINNNQVVGLANTTQNSQINSNNNSNLSTQNNIIEQQQQLPNNNNNSHSNNTPQDISVAQTNSANTDMIVQQQSSTGTPISNNSILPNTTNITSTMENNIPNETQTIEMSGVDSEQQVVNLSNTEQTQQPQPQSNPQHVGKIATSAASSMANHLTSLHSLDDAANLLLHRQHGQTKTNPAGSTEDGQNSSEDGESASGTSTVAIDNKIEQAMDLVKSHLMFAVREEVEVLKEKIAELMDRINQLEVENTILKANASQETLSQLSANVASAKVSPPNPTNGPVS